MQFSPYVSPHFEGNIISSTVLSIRSFAVIWYLLEANMTLRRARNKVCFRERFPISQDDKRGGSSVEQDFTPNSVPSSTECITQNNSEVLVSLLSHLQQNRRILTRFQHW